MSRYRWQYQENDTFYDFEEATVTFLEDQYVRQPFATIKLTLFGVLYEIDFSNWIRTDVRRGVQDKIRRIQHDQKAPSIATELLTKKAIFVWHYNDNGYRKIDPQTNAKFEKTFAKNQNAKFLINMGESKWVVDFGAMTMTSYDTSSSHQLLRLNITENKGFVAPAALQKAQRKIVFHKIKSSNTKVITPLEQEIFALVSKLPLLPNFSPMTISTIDPSRFNVALNLPILSNEQYEHNTNCPICYTEILHKPDDTNQSLFEDIDDFDPEYNCKVTALPCGHIFHHVCAQESLKRSTRCPGCRRPATGAVCGHQPEGTMSIQYQDVEVPGFKYKGAISLNFDMRGGVQTERQPNPGVSYSGDSRSAYLPCTAQGFRALRWMALAWLHYTLFAVGYSGTRQCDDVVIYNLHLKTSIHGSDHGYPDKDYLKRFHAECKEQGVPVEEYDPTYDTMDPRTAPEPEDPTRSGLAGLNLDVM